MTRMTAEKHAFALNGKKDGFTYWVEDNSGVWSLFRRGKGIDREAYDV